MKSVILPGEDELLEAHQGAERRKGLPQWRPWSVVAAGNSPLIKLAKTEADKQAEKKNAPWIRRRIKATR